MADLTQTAANVAISGSATPTKRVQFGESVTQGNSVYLKASDGKYWKSDANLSLEAAGSKGIVLTPASSDGYGLIAVPSDIEGTSLVNLGATLAVGTPYGVSATAGAICPIADISATQYPTIIGFATTTAVLDYKVVKCSSAKA